VFKFGSPLSLLQSACSECVLSVIGYYLVLQVHTPNKYAFALPMLEIALSCCDAMYCGIFSVRRISIFHFYHDFYRYRS
jgi:hypothetical protein